MVNKSEYLSIDSRDVFIEKIKSIECSNEMEVQYNQGPSWPVKNKHGFLDSSESATESLLRKTNKSKGKI